MIYGTTQQMLRLGANEPQVQLSEDTANKLNGGLSVKSINLPEKVEISQSLSPYIIILDQNKKVLSSSATLNGIVPVIPSGIFDSVAKNGEERVTWQPQPGVRQAIVVNKYSDGSLNGFVVAGRSLRETEFLIDKLGRDIFVGWIAINLFAIVSYSIICSSFFKDRN